MERRAAPLNGVSVVELGCGTIGAIAGRHLVLLGGTVTHICVGAPCDLADGNLPVDYMLGKSKLCFPDLSAIGGDVMPPDILVVDPLDQAEAPTGLWTDAVRVSVGSGCCTELENQGLLAEAHVGMASEIGFSELGPQPLGMLFGEVATALEVVCAAVQGLYVAKGSNREVAALIVPLEHSCISNLDTTVQDIGFGRVLSEFGGSHRRGLFPYGLFQGHDGMIGIAGSWDTLLRELGVDELREPAYQAVDFRLEHRLEIIKVIEAWLSEVGVDDAVNRIGNDGIAERAVTLSAAWQNGDLWEIYDNVKTVANPYIILTRDRQSD